MENEEKQEVTESISVVDKAEAAAKRIEEANKKAEELLKKQEEIAARGILGGKSNAGIQPVAPKEESPIEYAERVRKGLVNPFEV